MTRRRLAGVAAAAVLAAGALVGYQALEPQRIEARAPARAENASQIAALRLLARVEGDCGCTGEARARDRVADGRAQAPPAGS